MPVRKPEKTTATETTARRTERGLSAGTGALGATEQGQAAEPVRAPRSRRVAVPAPRKKASASRRSPRELLPEDMLARAMAAETPRSRAMWARRGLGLPGSLDPTTQAMLLRQLYLSYYETRRFKDAALVAEQAAETGVLPDVAHQDAARARQALGDVDGAAGHLRIAARVGPANRKAFHWWTLGSLYFLAGRYAQAASALQRAARWGTTDKPLYQGHLAVVRCASGQRVDDLRELSQRLAEVPAGQGYGRFILGHLAYYDGRLTEARRYLEAFVRRSSSGRAVLAIALAGEIEAARRLLATLGRS
ncbi:MAG TPA: tetratricopeptide repeat protein [Polyangiaceae bacterium]|nr:tetratricopeptide repeat protein [Polyangiaceae bacterium]